MIMKKNQALPTKDKVLAVPYSPRCASAPDML